MEDDDVVIARVSFEYFEELIKFRKEYDCLYRKWRDKNDTKQS